MFVIEYFSNHSTYVDFDLVMMIWRFDEV